MPHVHRRALIQLARISMTCVDRSRDDVGGIAIADSMHGLDAGGAQSLRVVGELEIQAILRVALRDQDDVVGGDLDLGATIDAAERGAAREDGGEPCEPHDVHAAFDEAANDASLLERQREIRRRFGGRSDQRDRCARFHEQFRDDIAEIGAIRVVDDHATAGNATLHVMASGVTTWARSCPGMGSSRARPTPSPRQRAPVATAIRSAPNSRTADASKRLCRNS